MPARTPDKGVQRFEIRTGLANVPVLGGIFRAGDPAVIPPHKQHMAVNVRITPSGMISRPGLSETYDTGVAECITGLTTDGEEYSTLLLAPGADSVPNTTMAATFQAIFPRGGDETYFELLSVLYGSSETDPVLGFWPVLGDQVNAAVPAYGQMYGGPFIYQGRACGFILMPKERTDGSGTVDMKIAVLAMDLPTRTKELGNVLQVTGYSGSPVEPWPHGYPVGTSGVVIYLDNPFPGAEVIDLAYGVTSYLVDVRRADERRTGSVGVREHLYYIVTGTLGSVAMRRWDGVSETTVFLHAAGTYTDHKIGKQIYGPFVLARSGAVGPNGVVLLDYGGYLNAAGAWVVASAGAMFDFSNVPPDPADPGLIDLEVCSWAPYQESLSGRGEVVMTAVTYYWDGLAWTVGTASFVLEYNRTTDRWDTVVATLKTHRDWSGITYPICDEGGYIFSSPENVEILGDTYNALFHQEDDIDIRRQHFRGAERNAAATFYVDDRVRYYTLEHEDHNPLAKWMKNVGGRIYLGGHFVASNIGTIDPTTAAERHAVYDVTPRNVDAGVVDAAVVPERIFMGGLDYSRYCLAGVPSGEVGEGFGTGSEEP